MNDKNTDLSRSIPADQAQPNSDELLSSILATTLDGFWRVDSRGRLIDVNRTYCQQSGYSRQELLAMSVSDLEANESPAETAEHILRAIARGGDRFESRHRRKDGSIWQLEVSASYSPLGGGQFMVFLRDISERKRSEAALRASEQRFLDMVNTTDGIVWEADATTFTFTFVSQKAERLLGFPTARWLEPGFWVNNLHPDDKAWAPEFCAACTGRLEPHDFEYRFIARDGRTVWLRDIVTVVAENDAPRWLRGIMVDVTVQKTMQAQLKELNDGLEKRVAERTAELACALDSLKKTEDSLVRSEAKATLSTLVASVTHELNTPIGNTVMAASALAGMAGELQQTIESGALKRSDLTQFLVALGKGTELMLRNLARAETLVKDFRQVAADQASEQRRSFDLADVVQEVVHSLMPSLKRQPQRIELNVPSGIMIDSQPGPLGQILINLINNAFLHGFENRPEGVLTIGAEVLGERAHLWIEDDGVGIPEENQARLFQPFFSTKIGHGGTGLGMAIVKNLVCKTLGGEITVDSALGRGTRFDILLPLVLPE